MKMRFGLFYSFILLFILSCNENLSELVLEEEVNQGLELFKGKIEDFPELTQLFDKTVTQKRTRASKNYNDELYNFALDSSSISKITLDDNNFYSIAIVRENGNENIFENLVISDKSEAEPLAFIINYYPDDAYWERFANDPNTLFSGQRSMVPLDGEKLTLSKSSMGCFTISTTYCGSDQHERTPDDNTPAGDLAGPGCTEPYTVTTTVCIDAGDSTSGGGDFDIGNQGTGGGNPGGDTGESGNSNPSDDILTSDVITTLNIPYASLVKEKMGYSSFSYKGRWVDKQENFPVVQDMLIFLNRNQNSDAAKERVDEIIEEDIDRNTLSAFPFVKYPKDKAAEYRRDFPKLTEYLENQLPKLADNILITRAFKKFTNMTDAQIKEAFKWDEGPEIVIKDIEGSGHFQEPNIIEIDIDLVNALENADSGSEYSEKVLFAVAATIVHEAVHYGDYAYNNDYYRGNNPCSNEEGWLFEQEVYDIAIEVGSDGTLTILSLPFNCN
jgi:hypothetical protein